MQPVFSKVAGAIETVAKEQAYTFIINSQVNGGEDVLLYWDEKYNVSDDVLKRLGVTPGPKTQTPKKP
jgi:outer membrane protein